MGSAARWTLILITLFLVGCAATGPDEAVYKAEYKRTIPTCHSEKECEVKWAAARRWIIDNSRFKFQHLTPTFMETYNPPEYSVSLGFRVSKEPLQNGGYKIVSWAWCRNTFRCDPNPWLALVSLNSAVNSSWGE